MTDNNKKQKTGETKNDKKSLTDVVTSADVLTNIASYLDYPLRSRSLTRVSRTWNRICETKQVLFKQAIKNQLSGSWKSLFLLECVQQQQELDGSKDILKIVNVCFPYDDALEMELATQARIRHQRFKMMYHEEELEAKAVQFPDEKRSPLITLDKLTNNKHLISSYNHYRNRMLWQGVLEFALPASYREGCIVCTNRFGPFRMCALCLTSERNRLTIPQDQNCRLFEYMLHRMGWVSGCPEANSEQIIRGFVNWMDSKQRFGWPGAIM
jgi:hypothetical protein